MGILAPSNIDVKLLAVRNNINDFICDGLEENANNNNEENIFFDRLLNDRRGLIRREYLINLVQ
ncbi:hypothetical protein PUN28_020215 [Cardiocondyla obscurior]|uniref:Uncharacterized protein n=1 Tax=Cardiocondyla obscurior TaxID=286306 RepID=A0AAW2E5P9_9HYME